MKLAEALRIRADLKQKIYQLKDRLRDSAKVQEGDKPAEQIDDLYKELENALKQLEELMFRINHTNIQTTYKGESLTQMIARKDVLSMRIGVLRDLMKHITETDRYGRNEIKYVRTIDVAKLRKDTDEYAKELRLLDLKLQELNWTVELI